MAPAHPLPVSALQVPKAQPVALAWPRALALPRALAWPLALAERKVWLELVAGGSVRRHLAVACGFWGGLKAPEMAAERAAEAEAAKAPAPQEGKAMGVLALEQEKKAWAEKFPACLAVAAMGTLAMPLAKALGAAWVALKTATTGTLA